MVDEARVEAVRRLLAEHVRSPSLRHIRDGYVLTRLSADIVRAVDLGNSLWMKWNGLRETLVRMAAPCWIPVQDLTAFLNGLPGPELTRIDVEQRLAAFQEEDLDFPAEEHRKSCTALYEDELAVGTELIAIIGAMRAHIAREEERLRSERETASRARVAKERADRERRFLIGADCKWATVAGSKDLYCRANGRAYRLAKRADKRWALERLGEANDPAGVPIGRYQSRGEATKAVSKIAYEPDLR